jgi:hypothetical protein
MMKLLHCSPTSCQGVPPSDLLQHACRLGDDVEPRHVNQIARNLGGDPSHLIQLSYRVVTGAFIAALRRQSYDVPAFVTVRKTIVLPCLNERGEIVGLHDQTGQWLFGPVSHVANPKRASFEPVRICRSTSEADALALSMNVCVIVAHGQPIIDLMAHLTGTKARAAA